MSSISIYLNGSTLNLNHQSLLELIAANAPKDRPYAVEINGIIIPRSEHKIIKLKEDDKVEIITAVGGG